MNTKNSDTENPWTTLDTKVIYQNPWIKVREDSVIRPDGKSGIYGVVETKVATGVVAINELNEIYLVGQYRYPINRYSWEIVEGGAEHGEEPILAAKRELKEEAGIVAKEWSQLGPKFYLSNCFSSEEALVFLARNLKIGEAEPEGTEALQLKKIPFRSALDMVESGEISDSISIIGILRAKSFLRL